MDVKDLMIGDFVSLGDGVINARVLEITKDSIVAECDDGDIMEFTHFWPVPLTEEILIANGFRGFDMSKDSSLIGYSLRGIKNLTMLDWNMQFNYVHELQHALRLCGLNDFADNFKLKAMEE